MILVPVKNLKNAKQRLSPVLDGNARLELAQAMVFDVLEVLASWPGRPAVGVVTSDPYANELARHFNFEIIPDDAELSETDAIAKATDLCARRGVDSTLVIPGDIPLLEVWELEKILEFAPDEGSVLVPSHDGRGTNAALRKPANLFPLRFGNDSFEPHLDAAQATGLSSIVLSLPGIALDIDNPADLQQLAMTSGRRRAQRLARQWNLTDDLLAAHE
jgi:2-phospho-L-lactate guanylyltransferase